MHPSAPIPKEIHALCSPCLERCSAIINLDSVLFSARLIHCCFAFGNLDHCQSGLSAAHFITAPVLRPLPNVSLSPFSENSASNQCKQSGLLIFCIDLLTRSHFSGPALPRGPCCNTATLIILQTLIIQHV